MRTFSFLPRFLAGCLALFLTTGAEADQLADLKAVHQTAWEKIQAENQEELTKLSDQLIAALGRGKEDARKKGDLDLVKAYDTQIELIKLSDDPGSVESTFPEITKLENVYHAAKEQRAGRMQRSIVAWQKAYDLKLKELEMKLVADDDIPAAESVRAERETTLNSQPVQDAIAEVARLDAMEAEKPAEPTATPPSGKESPWSSLKSVKWDRLTGSEYFLGMIKDHDPIQMGKETYKARDVLYAHAPGRIVYKFKTPITEFRATGCLEERSSQGDVTFVVETEDGEVFRGKRVNKDRNEEPIAIKFKPATTLVLSVEDNGGAQQDWSFWLHPQYR